MPSTEDVKHLHIPLKDILLATDGFADKNLLAKGGFGKVYRGLSNTHGRIAIKRWDHGWQGDREFKTEIVLLSKHKHENIVSLIGFCDEDGEKILVYRYASNASLDRHLNNKDLMWTQRLQICLDVARGLKYLHYDVGRREQILHRDVKSSNILLDENWKPKISDFGLARVGPASMKSSFVISNVCGTRGYIDPEYYINGYLTQKSDVYSFGVVLWEVLCGRLAHVVNKDERVILSILVQRHYINGTLSNIIPSDLQNQIDTTSLLTFTDIAYQCLKNVQERPTMRQVVEQLQKALDYQLAVKKPDEGKKAEEEAKQTPTRDQKNGEESKNPQPPPSPQEIVLSTFMHCEDCARKVRQCLKGFEGVEDVHTNCDTQKVVVKGDKADPLKVLTRVQKKCGRKVELISPVLKLPEEHKKQEQHQVTKQEEKKLEPMAMITVVLKVYMHCHDCARKMRKCILMVKGVESALPDPDNSQVAVKGNFPVAQLVEHVYKKTGKKAVIIKQESYSKTEKIMSNKDYWL